MILDIDETGAAAKIQSRTFGAARFCVRKTRQEKDVGGAELGLLHARFRRIGADLGGQLKQVYMGTDVEGDADDGNSWKVSLGLDAAAVSARSLR